MSLIIPCCCSITETGCVFPPFYPNPRKGNGETGTCCRFYPTGNCCVYDIFGYKIECLEGVTLAGCNAKIIPGDTTTKFIPYEGNFKRSDVVLGCDRTKQDIRKPPFTGPCDIVEGIEYKCIDGFDQPTIRDICCDVGNFPTNGVYPYGPIVGDGCTNPNNVTKHIFWISYDGEESYTRAGGFTGIFHIIESDIFARLPPIFRGRNSGNIQGCNIIDGIYTETWTNRIDSIGGTEGTSGFPKYGLYTLTTPTDHAEYDRIVSALQQYVDDKNTQYNSYLIDYQGIPIGITAQWKLNDLSWLWYDSSTKKYQFDPPCVSWTTTLDRTFTGKYGEAYSTTIFGFTQAPPPGISSDCDQGCCCNNIQPIANGDIGCQCKDTCGSISTTTNLNFSTTGKCIPSKDPNQPSAPKINFISNNTINIPIVVDVNKYLGSNLGGSIITITGNNLINTTNIIIGGNTASDVTVNSDTSVTFTTPPGNTGIVEIDLISETSSAKLVNKFAYTDTPQDLFGYLFWVTKGIVNTTEFVSNDDCRVNSTQSTISTDELFLWNDQPDSFKFDEEWNNILQIVSDLNSNPDSISKGEFYAAHNMKYLQFDGSTHKTYKSPCVEIIWNWYMTNPGCVDTFTDKLGWECVPCLNDCCLDVCLVDSENIEILSKCGSFSKTQYIGQADCGNPISITTSSSNNKLLAITPIDPIDPTNTIDRFTTTTQSQYTTCECIDNITECDCVNQKPGWMDWYRTDDGFIYNRTQSEVWSWSSSSTKGSAGETEPCAGCKASCCVKGPDGENLFKLDNLTKCECDALTTATAVGSNGKYNGNVASFGNYDCFKVDPRSGFPTTNPDGILFCPCGIPPLPDCSAMPYTVVFTFSYVFEQSQVFDSNGLLTFSQAGPVLPLQFGSYYLSANPIERQKTLDLVTQGLRDNRARFDNSFPGGTQLFVYAEKTFDVPYCGLFLQGNSVKFVLPASFTFFDFGNGDTVFESTPATDVSAFTDNLYLKNGGQSPDLLDMGNPGLDPNPKCDCPIIDVSIPPLPPP
jgi:hypothetical protein